MKFFFWLLKKTECLSALSIKLVYLTGKSKVPVHPKHLITQEKLWYGNLLDKKMSVLDAGCGSGQHALKIAPYVLKVVGIDKNLKNLKIAKESTKIKNIKNVDFIKGDLEKRINLPSASFNLAILFDILEHIVERQKFLQEVRRLLKNNGKAIVVIPNNDTAWKKLQRNLRKTGRKLRRK